MSATPIIVRPADQSDAGLIAEINASGWLDSYRGIIPDSVLARVRPNPERWAGVIARVKDPSHFLVASEGAIIVGFVAVTEQRDDALRARKYRGEIAALYVRATWHGRGIGHRLLGEAARGAKATDLVGLGVWTLSGSAQSCGFYRGAGGIEVGRRDVPYDGVAIACTGFGWTADMVERLILQTVQGASHATSRTI